MTRLQLLVGVLILVSAASASARDPVISQPGVGTSAPPSLPASLWSDPPNLDGDLISSEVIGAAGLTSEVANDFTVVSGSTVQVARWWGGYFNCDSYPACNPHVSSFVLRFYDNSACTPQNLLAEIVVPSNAHESLVHLQNGAIPIFEYWADVSIPVTGTCWFSVHAADHAFPPQWGRLAAMGVRDCGSMFKSPFFGFPEWTDLGGLLGHPYDASQAFETIDDRGIGVRNYTPEAWQEDFVNWCRDVRPRNRVDDLIEASADPTFDIVVNFKRCVTDTDLNTINAMTGNRIGFVSEFLSTILVEGVSKSMVFQIAALEGVAFIEEAFGFAPGLDVSVPALKVTPSTLYSPSTVVEACPGIDGSGINIAILDTGIDNTAGFGVAHQTFTGTTFIGGYDASTKTFTDPYDSGGHGTAVASITLGQGVGTVSRGVAPAAGLIDVKVSPNAVGQIDCIEKMDWSYVMDGLETVYKMHTTGQWKVDVVNMSFWQCSMPMGIPVISDGKDALSQLIDLAESMGIVVVASMTAVCPGGFVAAPGAATRAVTVAPANDRGTIDRSDDVISSTAGCGPRSPDGDSDCTDELKPDVAAPGENIFAALYNTTNQGQNVTGGSAAAAHVSGIAALIMQKYPGINPMAVRDLLIKSCDQLGTPPSPPFCFPGQTWHDRWGWGLVDAYRAVCGQQNADPTFPSCPCTPFGWTCSDITTLPDPPKKGQPCTVTVALWNNGPNPATCATIHFGVHVYSVATPTFHDIGKKICVTLPVGGPTYVSIPWTPLQDGHQCLQAEIGYGADTDYACNSISRNIMVQKSPVYFTVQNTVTEAPARIHFAPVLEHPPGINWDWVIEPEEVTLGAHDCPVTISAELFPLNGAPGDTARLHIQALIETPNGPRELGGVTVMDIIENPASADPASGAKDLALTLLSKNPVRGSCAFSYSIPRSGRVHLHVFDVVGRRVASIVDADLDAGRHQVSWDGRDQAGNRVASGVYYLALTFDGAQSRKEVVIAR